jgi:creatinine amidohydrolase
MVFETLGSHESSWADRTYEEVRTVAEQDGSILVVPVGSVEQHGHHMPVGTDSILVDAIAKLGTRRVSDSVPILKTPPVWSGFSPHHMAFGGTITLDFDTCLTVLEQVADSALDNGFDALLLLNGHGGNKPLITAAVSTIGDKHGDVEVLGLTYFELASSFIDDVRDSELGGMAHGGEFETSLMLHLQPELVDMEQSDAEILDEHYDRSLEDLVEGGPLAVYRGFEEYSASGAIGAPELATEGKGEEIYRKLGDELETILLDVYDQNR